MVTTTKPVASADSFFLIALVVLISCWGLFWLDHETHSISDLFKIGNLVALVVYFLPTFLIACFLYVLFIRKNTNRKSLMKALVIGIPLGFFVVIFAFYFGS